ncbi:putative cation-transporting ATPase, partial [Stegodyphus mimosarum]
MMSYIAASIIFVTGAPYKRHFFSNQIYVCIVCAEIALASYLILDPAEAVMKYLNFKAAPDEKFPLILYAICLGNIAISFIWEKYFVQHLVAKHIVPLVARLRGPVRKFKKLQQQLQTSEEWPPLINDKDRGEMVQIVNQEKCSVVDMI